MSPPDGATGPGGERLPLFRPEVLRPRQAHLDGAAVSRVPVELIGMAIAAGAAALLLAAGFLWLPLPQVTQLRGEASPEGGLTVLSAPQAGRLSRLAVREGDEVAAGATLALVSADLRPESRSRADQQIASALAAYDAQDAEASAGARGAATRSAATRRKIAELERALDLLAGQRRRAEQLVALNATTAERGRDLVDRGYLTQLAQDSREAALIAAEQAVADIELRQSEARAEIGALRADLADTRTQALQARRQLADARDAANRKVLDAQAEAGVAIVADVAGRVAAIHSQAGSAVALGDPVVSLVPRGAGAGADLYARAREVRLIHPGMVVRVRPAEADGRTEAILGKVSFVSTAPRRRPDGREDPAPFYRVRVAFTSPRAAELPVAGAAVTGSVVLSRRSLADQLFRRSR